MRTRRPVTSFQRANRGEASKPSMTGICTSINTNRAFLLIQFDCFLARTRDKNDVAEFFDQPDGKQLVTGLSSATRTRSFAADMALGSAVAA